MNIRPTTTLLLVAALATAGLAQSPDMPAPAAEAQPTAAATTPAAGNGAALPTLFADHPAAASTASPSTAPRTVSPELASVLATGNPKYDPPKPADPAAETAEAPDARDIDKPKNEIKRLPSYVVRAPKPIVFRDRDLFTQDGQVALSMTRNPGLGFFPFSALNAPIAAQMFQDKERLDNISDLADTARTMSLGGDSSEGRYILRATQDTFMRDNDFGWNGWSGTAK